MDPVSGKNSPLQATLRQDALPADYFTASLRNARIASTATENNYTNITTPPRTPGGRRQDPSLKALQAWQDDTETRVQKDVLNPFNGAMAKGVAAAQYAIAVDDKGLLRSLAPVTQDALRKAVNDARDAHWPATDQGDRLRGAVDRAQKLLVRPPASDVIEGCFGIYRPWENKRG